VQGDAPEWQELKITKVFYLGLGRPEANTPMSCMYDCIAR
jgi:hypothetical protein